MSDKCREAWEKLGSKMPEESRQFALTVYPYSYAKPLADSLAIFHAGYHARKIPTVEQVRKLVDRAYLREADTTSISMDIIRLMVEGGE